MNHNDIVRQSFKKQAEKFVAYHMSKVELFSLHNNILEFIFMSRYNKI